MAKLGNKPATTKPVATKQVATKPATTKQAAAKPAQKAVQPKKQVPNAATKNETKLVPVTTPKQKTEKRKREENGSTPVHDVDKKMKEASESQQVIPSGKKIVYSNVPETAQASDFDALFADFSVKPYVKILSYKNKERVGDVYVYFQDDDAFNQAAALTNVSIGGQELIVSSDNNFDGERTVYVQMFPDVFDSSEISQFFDGCQISRIHHLATAGGRVSGKFFVEFADAESKQAALEKSNSKYKEITVAIFPFEINKPKIIKKHKKTNKAPTNKAEKKTTPQKKAPATKDPNQNKVAPPKNPNQNKPAQIKNPNQNKPAQTKNPNQKNPAQTKKSSKPVAQHKKGANGAAKAQKKN